MHYTFSVDDNGILSICEDGKIMAEISDVSSKDAYEVFKEIVFEKRNIIIDNTDN